MERHMRKVHQLYCIYLLFIFPQELSVRPGILEHKRSCGLGERLWGPSKVCNQGISHDIVEFSYIPHIAEPNAQGKRKRVPTVVLIACDGQVHQLVSGQCAWHTVGAIMDNVDEFELVGVVFGEIDLRPVALGEIGPEHGPQHGRRGFHEQRVASEALPRRTHDEDDIIVGGIIST